MQLARVHVDREQELRRYNGMIGNEGEAHVLLIRAEVGMGKTTLLEEFYTRADGLPRASITLRRTYRPRDIMKRLSRRLNASSFATFRQREEQLYGLAGSRLAAASAPLKHAGPGMAPGLSPELHAQLQWELTRTSAFNSDRDLRAVFVEEPLQPWANELEAADSPRARVEQVIAQLYQRFNTEGENALVLLVRALARKIHPGDSLHAGLLYLAEEVERQVAPSWDERKSGAGVPVGGTLEGRRRRAFEQPEQAELRRRSRTALTDAFFDDLRALPAVQESGRVVLLIDDFDQANEEAREWLADYFLESVLPHRELVVVIAGTDVPELEIGQSTWCLSSKLSRLELDHVREYVQRLELEVEPALIEAFYLYGGKGEPLKMREAIELWLRERPGVGSDVG